ncbi:o-succinylbenzoate--CoA ligase [Cellulomonas hominis]
MSRPVRVLATSPDVVDDLAVALTAALDGHGPAVLAVGTARAAAPPTGAASVRSGADPSGAPDAGRGPDAAGVPDDVALVVRTSGSTGAPRDVLLTADALRASAGATADRLAGPGGWLLALPTDHVAGLQVLVRSVLAGTTPEVLPTGPFRPGPFAAAATRLLSRPGPHYTSLVPTQLHRLLDDPDGTQALRQLDAVLLGGAAAAPTLVQRARDAQVTVVTTYGMSETCGGCVYDGRPLDGVRVRVDDDGRVLLAGPVLARGYRDRPDLDATTFVLDGGTRWLRTSDLGRIGADGRTLEVLGRLDDVIVTGGVKVAPAAVERLLSADDAVAEVCVVALPDDEWGQAVTAVIVPRRGATAPDGDRLRALVSAGLGPASAPRHVVLVAALPVRGPGKTDRRAVAELAARELTRR